MLTVARSRVVEAKGNLDEALGIIQAGTNGKSEPLLKIRHIRLLRLLDRPDEAHEIYSAALISNSNNTLLVTEHVAFAMLRGNWSEALLRAGTAARNSPGDRGLDRLYARLGLILPIRTRHQPG